MVELIPLFSDSSNFDGEVIFFKHAMGSLSRNEDRTRHTLLLSLNILRGALSPLKFAACLSKDRKLDLSPIGRLLRYYAK